MMNQQETDQKIQKKKPQLNSYIKYSTLAFQMGGIIVAGVLLGSWLDKRNANETPWFTIGIGLFSIFAALYLTLRDFLKK